MKLLHFLLIKNSALGALAQLCTVSLKDGDSLKSGCGLVGGIVANNNTEIRRQYISSDLDTCSANCYQDLSCVSFSFNNKHGQCTTYAGRVHNQGFQRDKNSTTVFYNARCFHFGDACVEILTNPSFEAVYTGRPVRGGAGRQNIGLMPWAIANPSGSTTIAILANNSDVPFGGNASPDGDHFALVSVDSGNDTFLAQIVELKHGTTYTAEFQYAFFKYRGGPSIQGGPSNNYALIFDYRSDFTSNVMTLYPDNGDDDGVWRTYSTTFTTPDHPRKGLDYVGIFIATPSDPANHVKRAIFGFDAITLVENG